MSLMVVSGLYVPPKVFQTDLVADGSRSGK